MRGCNIRWKLVLQGGQVRKSEEETNELEAATVTLAWEAKEEWEGTFSQVLSGLQSSAGWTTPFPLATTIQYVPKGARASISLKSCHWTWGQWSYLLFKCFVPTLSLLVNAFTRSLLTERPFYVNIIDITSQLFIFINSFKGEVISLYWLTPFFLSLWKVYYLLIVQLLLREENWQFSTSLWYELEICLRQVQSKPDTTMEKQRQAIHFGESCHLDKLHLYCKPLGILWLWKKLLFPPRNLWRALQLSSKSGRIKGYGSFSKILNIEDF